MAETWEIQYGSDSIAVMHGCGKGLKPGDVLWENETRVTGRSQVSEVWRKHP